MAKAISFYNWFLQLGGDVKSLDVGNLVTTLNIVHVQFSSFKHRTEEIKQLFNHKFNA